MYFYDALIVFASSKFNPYHRHVIASLGKALHGEHLCRGGV